ncbi:MAG: FAD-binding protein [Deltaproteobacteria bacterium]|nr:FAD-binding protein [Deltaproteobacteria bacterium]
MLAKPAITELKALLGPEYFSTRSEDLVLYASDGSNRTEFLPEAVARPGTTAEVAALIGIARKYKIPLVPRGAGSGLSGGALPVAGGLVVIMNRFNRILEIDAANLVAIVEPGVITGKFQAAVEAQGLFYPPDPASREFSTLGGNAAENAGGTRAVKYGVTRDYILGLEAVIGTGEVIQTGVRTAKGVVGFDLTRLVVGSEGTLGIITRLILRLVPAPEAKETMVAYYDDMDAAAKTIAALTAAKVIPATVEFMDHDSINFLEDYKSFGLDRKAGALLLIETDGSIQQAKADAETTARVCRECGARQIKFASSAAEAELMWQARRALSTAICRAASGKYNEDVVVPRTLIPEMLARLEVIGKKHRVLIINFGHAGDGNIHLNVMYNKYDPEEVRRAEEACREIFITTLELGGTISGEHGVGIAKKDYIALEIPAECLNLMLRVKAAFDPDGIMNPGKIFP